MIERRVTTRNFAQGWNEFFHRPRDPLPCAWIRIGLCFLLLINSAVLAPDLIKWFGEEGAIPFAASRTLIDSGSFNLFRYLPLSHHTLWAAFLLYNFHILAVLVGWRTRLNTVLLFVWVVSFQHRNVIILDGEDTVFRLITFLLIFMPAGARLALDARRNTHARRSDSSQSLWALRLLQIQMTLIYTSTVILKLRGDEWRDGTAVYYVARLDDLFGRFPLPMAIFESLPAVRGLTWSVVMIELLLPFLLWIPRTRLIAVMAAVTLHVSLDYAMNLMLFEWIMIVGLLSFVTPEDFRRTAGRARLWTGSYLPAGQSSELAGAAIHQAKVDVNDRHGVRKVACLE